MVIDTPQYLICHKNQLNKKHQALLNYVFVIFKSKLNQAGVIFKARLNYVGVIYPATLDYAMILKMPSYII